MGGFTLHYAKIVGGGLLAAGLVIAVIVLGVEVARLSSEVNDLTPDATTTPGPPTTEDPSTLEPWDRDYRLPDSVIPEHYELLIHPTFAAESDTNTFTGSVTIDLTITEEQKYLTIHQKGLTIKNPVLTLITGGTNTVIDFKDHFPADRNEFYVFLPKSGSFYQGLYTLKMDFNGSLTQPELVGIYSSEYTDDELPEPNKKKLVTSKFEPTYARRAFPCMDEPAKKATFSVSLVQPENTVTNPWSSLSNMDVVETLVGEPSAGLTTVKFAKSVKMSTYLACFIVSEFDKLETTFSNGGSEAVTLRTFAPKHLVQYTQFALDAAKDITEFYVGYFGIDYPLPKLDLIGIPDFVSGAMEHWGLITFRESNLIVDDEKSSAANQQQVGQVVAHELAHMWFGNLVTMKWWDDLWLNEGFASFIEYKGLAVHKTEWGVEDQFVIQDLQPVMEMDAQLSSHPVIQHVAHPDQITSIFDTITYSKGSAVLRMLENFLLKSDGTDVFKIGIQKYLADFAYGNAETPDLWAALQKAADENQITVNVARVMDTWTKQMGLPVLSVRFDAAANMFRVTQERFLANPDAKNRKGGKEEESPFGYRWDVPISFRSKDNSSVVSHTWFLMENDEVTIAASTSGTPWIKLNVDQVGFYRVNYEPKMWSLFTVQLILQNHDFSPLDRSSLLDDVFSLAEGKRLEYSVALDLAEYLTEEKEYIPWSTAAARFQKITPLMRGKLAYLKYSEFLQSGVKTIYNELTWNDENPADTHLTKRLRSTILNHACSAGMTECLDEAGKLFDEWLTQGTAIKPNVRQLAYVFGMEQTGNSEKWQKVWEKYLTEKDAQEKTKLQLSLAAIKEPWILEMFVELAWSEENVRGQDYFSVLQSISDNPVGTPIVWDYVRANWEKLVDRFTINSRNLGRMIPRITQNFATELKKKEMEDFFAQYPEAGAGESARAQALEQVDANIRWVAELYPSIRDWLSAWPTQPEKQQ